jgi:hypothetical protein
MFRHAAESSTILWETVPDVVMDASVREHHRIARKQACKYEGYESATEGDRWVPVILGPLLWGDDQSGERHFPHVIWPTMALLIIPWLPVNMILLGTP